MGEPGPPASGLLKGIKGLPGLPGTDGEPCNFSSDVDVWNGHSF